MHHLTTTQESHTIQIIPFYIVNLQGEAKLLRAELVDKR